MNSVLAVRCFTHRLLRGHRHLQGHKPSIPCYEFSSKVPDAPTWEPVDPKSLPEVPPLDDAMIEHLERLSLVEFNNEEGVERLRSAIEYANQLHVVDTVGVEPMYSVLEDRELLLDEDIVKEKVSKEEVLQNAKMVEEDFFVAPPGNIPLTKANKLRKTEQSDEISEVTVEKSN